MSKPLKSGTKIDDQSSIPPTAGFRRSALPCLDYHASWVIGHYVLLEG